VQRIAERIGRSLERSGLITRDIENAWLAFDPSEEPPIHGLLGASITYRIATGPREGQKVFTLQTLPAKPDAPRREVAEASGFSLHAGIAAKPSQRDKLERLARYVARPPVATEPLALTGSGHVRYTLKTPYRDGTTHVIFEPEDFCSDTGNVYRGMILTMFASPFVAPLSWSSSSGRAKNPRAWLSRSAELVCAAAESVCPAAGWT
jgi:hypothetical protein